jgi:hypothetical protein
MLRFAVAIPAGVSESVTYADVLAAVGVAVIAQVLLFNIRPAGKLPFVIVHV